MQVAVILYLFFPGIQCNYLTGYKVILLCAKDTHRHNVLCYIYTIVETLICQCTETMAYRAYLCDKLRQQDRRSYLPLTQSYAHSEEDTGVLKVNALSVFQ